MICARCGSENPADAKFCAQCAAPLEAEREVRKTVTVVFCDITGEVVAGAGGTLVTGDAVNVAARLEQAAPPGEVYVGADTLGLVHGRVEVEPVEPLGLKGKSEPVAAYRLVSVATDEPRRV